MSADVGYMLKSAVSVRRAQRKHVRRDQAAEHAWKEGIAIVQADFGAPLDRPGETRSPGARSPSQGVAWGPVPAAVLSGRCR